jgi:hypothetical protein
MKTEQLRNLWVFFATSFGGLLGADALQNLSAAASIFAHLGTGLAALCTCGATIYWIRKGRHPKDQ